MSGLKPPVLIGTVCAVVAIPIVLAVAPKSVAGFFVIPALTVIAVYVLWSLVDLICQGLLRLTRGVTAIASDRSRREQFSQPWDRAKGEISSWGVGMTSVSRDDAVIRAAVQRGVRVRFEILDAEWLRKHPEISKMVDETYGRTNFVTQIEESTKKLIRLARELNYVYGSDRVQVFAVQAFIRDSATIADPGTKDAWGWVEFHTFGFPHGQVRLRLRTYQRRSTLNPPLLEHIVSSRSSVPKVRVDVPMIDETDPDSLTFT